MDQPKASMENGLVTKNKTKQNNKPRNTREALNMGQVRVAMGRYLKKHAHDPCLVESKTDFVSLLCPLTILL